MSKKNLRNRSPSYDVLNSEKQKDIRCIVSRSKNAPFRAPVKTLCCSNDSVSNGGPKRFIGGFALPLSTSEKQTKLYAQNNHHYRNVFRKKSLKVITYGSRWVSVSTSDFSEFVFRPMRPTDIGTTEWHNLVGTVQNRKREKVGHRFGLFKNSRDGLYNLRLSCCNQMWRGKLLL